MRLRGAVRSLTGQRESGLAGGACRGGVKEIFRPDVGCTASGFRFASCVFAALRRHRSRRYDVTSRRDKRGLGRCGDRVGGSALLWLL